MKYYALMDKRVCGPLEAETLLSLPDFGRGTLVQAQERFDSDNSRWTEAGEVPLLAVLMDTRDRGASQARSAAALDAYTAARRANERDALSLKLEVVESVVAQRAAMEGARDELARLGARLEAAEAALKGIRGAIYSVAAVAGLVGLAALGLAWRGGRPAPEAPVAPVTPTAPPIPAATPSRPVPAPAPARPPAPKPVAFVLPPPPAPAPDPADGQAAVELVRGFLLTAPSPERCPRTLEEALDGEGGPARTPQELVDCGAARRAAALRAALVDRQRWSKRKADKFLRRVFADRGGFDAVFPAASSARLLGGRTYEVELSRRDLLTPALSVLLNADFPAGALPAQRYEADLATGSLRP
ncbi:MAG: hypothetical protein HY928_09980 [Elusimicrobia bacterium]|nr:hypothetical protein [Elusimicrobiota bacterium]